MVAQPCVYTLKTLKWHTLSGCIYGIELDLKKKELYLNKAVFFLKITYYSL